MAVEDDLKIYNCLIGYGNTKAPLYIFALEEHGIGVEEEYDKMKWEIYKTNYKDPYFVLDNEKFKKFYDLEHTKMYANKELNDIYYSIYMTYQFIYNKLYPLNKIEPTKIGSCEIELFIGNLYSIPSRTTQEEYLKSIGITRKQWEKEFYKLRLEKIKQFFNDHNHKKIVLTFGKINSFKDFFSSYLCIEPIKQEFFHMNCKGEKSYYLFENESIKVFNLNFPNRGWLTCAQLDEIIDIISESQWLK